MSCRGAWAAGLLLALSLPAVAEGHAFGVRYDLPLPLGLFLGSAAAAVGLSFLITLAVDRGRGGGRERVPLYQILIDEPDRSSCLRFAALSLKLLGVAIFFLLIVAGFLGDASPSGNLAPVGVWVIWWVGFTLFTAFVGNLWPLLDPWRSLHAVLPRLGAKVPYPGWLQGWPAVALLFAVIWMELIGDLAEQPESLSRIIISYSIILWLMMTIFGREAWLRHMDPFERLFSLMGHFAPIGRSRALAGGPIVLRLPGAALTDLRMERASDLAFVLLILASVSFDGFTETPLWASFLQWCSESMLLRPLLLWAEEGRLGAMGVIKSACLLATPLIFAAILSVFCCLASRMSGARIGTWRLILLVAPSLLPIAIAYHLSHYLSYLLIAGQLAISLASDPFALGWDLFGTRGRLIDIGVIGAKDVWYVSVSAIVVGHVIAVFLSHSQIVRLVSSQRQAVAAELPILLLMMAFTASSLWMLSQPLVLQ
jgi:hypothetical protein